MANQCAVCGQRDGLVVWWGGAYQHHSLAGCAGALRQDNERLQATLDSVSTRDEQQIHRDVVRLRQLVANQQAESATDLASLSQVMGENRRLRSQIHEMRGLLETVLTHTERGSLDGMVDTVWLSREWCDKTYEMTRKE